MSRTHRASSRAAAPGQRWILRAAAGFDGHEAMGGPVDLLIEGDRIATVSTATRAPVGTSVPVVEVPGGFAMPGLINAHEHLLVTHHLTDPDQGVRTTVFGPHWRNAAVPGYLMDFGVTTIHGLAGPLFGELALRDRLLPAFGNAMPDYLTVGPIGTSPGGYPPYVDSRSGRLLLVKAESATPAEARAWVRYLWARGVDAIKVATGDNGYGGRSLPDSMRHDDAVLDESVDEAHRLGLRVFAHAYGIEGFRAALRAGVDVLAHLPVDRLSDDDVAAVVEASAIVIPTLFHMHCRVNARFPDDAGHNGEDFDAEAWQREFSLMENDEAWGQRVWSQLHRFDRPLGSSNPCFVDEPLDFDLVARSTANMRASLRLLHAAGARIAYGQDSSHSIPYRELREMARCGLTPAEVLAAATTGAAAAIDRSEDRGALAAGRRADLVVYERSPLEDLAALAELPALVVRNGEIVRGRAEPVVGLPADVPARFPALDRSARARFVGRYLGALAAGAVRGVLAPHLRSLYAPRACDGASTRGDNRWRAGQPTEVGDFDAGRAMPGGSSPRSPRPQPWPRARRHNPPPSQHHTPSTLRGCSKTTKDG